MRYSMMLAALLLAPVAARADADIEAGKTSFNKCAICHSIKQGENKIGPSLYGIVGRPAHSIEGYSYSAAMKAYDVTWDAATLDTYLVDPRKVVQGTKMIYPGLKNDAERANVIAYLATLK
ncbi:MAG: cytochrome c family protein [Pseudomonadota bacterium]|nr:cytochrome c family protein [Pseudomonadota bacterium]